MNRRILTKYVQNAISKRGADQTRACDFRVIARRVIDDVGTTEEQVFYVHGQGNNAGEVIDDATARTHRFADLVGWDSFELHPTIADRLDLDSRTKKED